MESTPTSASSAPFADWTAEQRSELESHSANPLVGTRLLLESARARVWEIRLAPGERLAFHRHVLDYVWTCVSGGRAISRDGAGNTNRVDYAVAETRALCLDAGASMIHDLENVGREEIVFTTVEFLDSDNAPLPLASGA